MLMWASKGLVAERLLTREQSVRLINPISVSEIHLPSNSGKAYSLHKQFIVHKL